jgi:hypothetical protein
MLKAPKEPKRPPKEKPSIEISDDEQSTTSSLPSSPCLSRKDVEIEEVDKLSLNHTIRNGKKRSRPQSSPKKDS